MGQIRDAAIEAFRDRAGLTVPSSEEREWFSEVREAALNLITVIALEESGIRDGDGCWSGSDALDGSLARFAELRRDLPKQQ